MKYYQILKMDLLNIFTNPAWFIMSTLFPLCMSLIMSYMSQAYYGDTVSALDYYSVTIIIFTAANAAVMAANTFLEDRIKRANLRVMYAPISKFEMTFTKVMATFIYVTFWLIVLGGFYHFVCNVKLLNIKFWILIIMLCFMSSVLGVMFACIFKSEETANMIVSTVISMCAVLGGSFFMIPKFFQKISNLSYLKWMNEFAFRVLYGNHRSILLFLVVLISISVLGLIVIHSVFKEEDYL